MRLHILGKTNDDRGTQLETLTKELLESLGYERLKMNVANDAGEVDVDCEFIIPLPVEAKHTQVIAECKAHKDALNMTDWLKFLGKVFLAEANNDDVAGCLVALSGVNGNVLGSYESLKRKNIRLVDSTTLIEYLSKSHGLAPRTRMLQYLASTGTTHLSVDLAYYQRRVYWVVAYANGEYTVLQADLTYPSDSTLDLIKPMVEDRLETGTFVDLRKLEAARRARLLAGKLIMTGAMIGNGSTHVDEVVEIVKQHGLEEEVSKEDIQVTATELVQTGIMVLEDTSNRIKFHPDIETDMEVRRKLFVEFGREVLIARAVGCEWWDTHIDERLMLQACKIQADLRLDAYSQGRATELMRLSPAALSYAISPDPIIVTHHQQSPVVPPTEDMLAHDRNQFMRSLYSGLSMDFRRDELAGYFFSIRRIDALTRTMRLTVYTRDDSVLIDDEIQDADIIGEWHETTPSGEPRYIHLLPLPHYMEQRRAAAARRSEPAVAEMPSAQPPESSPSPGNK